MAHDSQNPPAAEDPDDTHPLLLKPAADQSAKQSVVNFNNGGENRVSIAENALETKSFSGSLAQKISKSAAHRGEAIPWWNQIKIGKICTFLVGVMLFTIILCVNDPFDHSGAKNRPHGQAYARDYSEKYCLALVLMAATWWATEALPLWVTALTIPVMGVLLKLPCQGGPRESLRAAHPRFAEMGLHDSVETVVLAFIIEFDKRPTR